MFRDFRDWLWHIKTKRPAMVIALGLLAFYLVAAFLSSTRANKDSNPWREEYEQIRTEEGYNL